MALFDSPPSDDGLRHRQPSRPQSGGKREQIAAAALAVMLEVGVWGATTRKIAAAAKVSVATLHYHFHDKEEIVFSVMEVFVESYRATLAQHFARDQTLHDRIEALIRFICGEIRRAPQDQLLLQEITLYMLRHPHAEPLAAAKDQLFRSLYVEALSNVSDAGGQSDDTIQRLGNLIFTGLVGMIAQWLSCNDDALLDQTADDLIVAAQGFIARTSQAS